MNRIHFRHFILSALVAITASFRLFAQAPNLISYQAEIRNASNVLLANTTVAIRISIVQTSATGTAVYVETHTPTTNANGLASVLIGGGTVVSGVFANINWATGPYYLKAEIDPAGGTAYSITSTRQMLSVPYALYSEKASNGINSGTAANQFLYWNGTAWTSLGAPTVQGNLLTFCDGTLKWTAGGVCPGSITALFCQTADTVGVLTKGLPANGVSSNVPYSGGNGGPYSGQSVSSTGVIGLTATLSAGNFANGSGSLSYTITGTPTSSGTASFVLNVGGKSCTLTRNVRLPAASFSSDLNCAGVTGTGNLTAGAAASNCSFSVPYSGGNGGYYAAQSVISSGVTGLTASLPAGILNLGSGNLTFNITGTPAAAGTASFVFTLAGRSCTISRTVYFVGSITSLSCATATKFGNLISGTPASGVSFVVQYSGGNGGTYNGQSISSTGVTGLTATLASGIFAGGIGSGSLTYTITGTPAAAGTASFALNIGGRACTFSWTVLTLPSLSTTPAYRFTTTSSVSGGNISSAGGGTISARGICWSTSANPTISLSTKTSDGTGTGVYLSRITGLIPNTLYYARAYATNAAGTAYGAQVSFSTIPATVSDADGNSYNVVSIGDQAWFKENLKVSKYRNGNVIPTGLSDAAWAATTAGACAIYNSDPANNATYGKLYNWYAVTDSRGLCPAGWHVPTDFEWTELENLVDPSTVSVGTLLKANSSLWINAGQGTDAFGFSALPGGVRSATEIPSYQALGTVGLWWTSSLEEPALVNALVRQFSGALSGSLTNGYSQSNGYSVRCLKDY